MINTLARKYFYFPIFFPFTLISYCAFCNWGKLSVLRSALPLRCMFAFLDAPSVLTVYLFFYRDFSAFRVYLLFCRSGMNCVFDATKIFELVKRKKIIVKLPKSYTCTCIFLLFYTLNKRTVFSSFLENWRISICSLLVRDVVDWIQQIFYCEQMQSQNLRVVTLLWEKCAIIWKVPKPNDLHQGSSELASSVEVCRNEALTSEDNRAKNVI